MLTTRVLLQYCIAIVIFYVNAALSENSENLLSKLLEKRSHGSKLIILVNKSSKTNPLLRSEDTPKEIDTSKGKKLDDTMIEKKKAKHYLMDILRSTGDENDPIVQETNQKFERALRSRCSVYIKCEKNCEKPKKKPKQDCQKSCKEVYDYLSICGSVGQKKKKKNYCESSDECKPKGKTMRPTWRY